MKGKGRGPGGICYLQRKRGRYPFPRDGKEKNVVEHAQDSSEDLRKLVHQNHDHTSKREKRKETGNHFWYGFKKKAEELAVRKGSSWS